MIETWQEAVARFPRRAGGAILWFALAVPGSLIRFLVTLPDRLILGSMELWADVITGTTWQGRLLGLLLLISLATLPGWAGRPMLSLMITTLWFAYVGQTWNILTGFTGLVSLGHSLFIGLGAYLGAGLLTSAGPSAWTAVGLGLGLGILAAAVTGAGIGLLSVQRGLSGVHFALLTLVCAELGRLAFRHVTGFGGDTGLVVAVPRTMVNPVVFYYLILVATLLMLVLSQRLRRSRFGHCCLAVREDAEAAEATGVDVGRTRLAAITLSAALAAPAGLFQAFTAGPLLPDQVFSLTRSLEILLGPMIGGLGTLFGPVFGALIVTPLAETLNGHGPAGLKPFCAGLALVLLVTFRPTGLWPWLARRLRLVPAVAPADASGQHPATSVP